MGKTRWSWWRSCITRAGENVGLGFEPGASENAPVVKALVARLQARGFEPILEHRLLVVLDDYKPLEKRYWRG